MTETDRRQSLLGKVRGLLDTADSYESKGQPEPAASYRAKAEQLMVSYAIEEFELAALDNRKGAIKPELRRFDYGELPEEIRRPLIDLFGALARHCGVRLGEYFYTRAVLVGYPQDLDYLELLYTGLRLHMSANITPQPSRAIGYAASLALLKESGKKWREIYPMMVKTFPERFVDSVANVRRNKDALEQLVFHDRWATADDPDFWAGDWVTRRTFELDGVRFMKEVPRPIGVRFTKEYTDFCKENNRERIYSDPQVYLRSFVEGYTTKIRRRLQELKAVRDEASSGKELVLVSIKDTLDEFFYEQYPDQRPHPADCDCDICHGYCRNPKCKRQQCVNYQKEARKPVRASAFKATAYDPAAAARGSSVAATADLSAATGKVSTPRRGELG